MSKRNGKPKKSLKTQPRRVAAFKKFLQDNKELGRRECVAEGIRRFGLRVHECESFITTWLNDGTLRSYPQPGEGPGRPRTIITSSSPSPS